MNKYIPDQAELTRINNIFTYHAPFGDQQERYILIREKAKELAITLLETTPHSREQSIALTKLEEAVFSANAAIARNETKVLGG